MRISPSLLFGLAAISYSIESLALPSDIEQAIRIEADSAVRNESRGETIYQGDVKISQGSLIISADRIVILDKNSQLDSIVATGNPTTLSQQLNAAGERVYASAQNIDYKVSTGMVQFNVRAQLSQGGSKITSEHISYNVKDQVINAQSSGEGSRVEMVIPAQVISKDTDTPAAEGDE